MKKRILTFVVCALLLGISLQGQLKAQGEMVGTVIAVTGKVINANDNSPVSVKIIAYDESGKKVNSTRSNESDGSYYLTKLQPGHNYNFIISDEKYLITKYSLNIPDLKKYSEISKDFIVYPKGANIKIKLNVPPFEFNKTKIKYAYSVLLEDQVSLFLENPDVKFSIVCFPDNDDNPAENATVSSERAQSLADFLIIKGIDPNRINLIQNTNTDPDNPKPVAKAAKGKKYIGTTYFVIN
jgi:outer membrane protein OmpA-like peptidoglycan-associated protein